MQMTISIRLRIRNNNTVPIALRLDLGAKFTSLRRVRPYMFRRLDLTAMDWKLSRTSRELPFTDGLARLQSFSIKARGYRDAGVSKAPLRL